MATVDIEPSSLALTPGTAEVFTLTVRNDGDEVEAYHLTAVDEAAQYVVIDPETLLVHPGETATAAATITLEHTGRWAVGDLIVRFHIVPAVSPEDFLVVEAIATIESFSDVAALLSPTSLQGRRGDDAEISIANAGNVHAYADIAVSAGEVAVAIDQAHVAIPAGSTESVGLTVRANRLLWRGDPVPHPFHLSVTPEGGEPISVEGTFTQLPLLPGWGLKALIGVAAALAVLGLVWLGAAVWGSGGRPPATTPPTTASEAPAPELVAVSLASAGQAGEVQKAGDPAIAVLDVQVEDATPEALVAVDVEWPDDLALAEWTCEGWVDPENERERSGQPRSGDECLIDPSGSGTEARLTFTTPPAGFTGAVTATAARLVTFEDGDVEAIESTTPPPQVAEELLVEAAPYPFWMEVEVAAPSASDDGTRRAVVWTHRTLGPEGTNERAQIAFQLRAPSFAEEPDLQAAQLPDGQPACDAGTEGDVCVLDFLVLADGFPQDLAVWGVPVSLEISDDDPPAGLIVARGVSLTVGDDDVPDDQVGEMVRSAEAPLLLSGGAFPVDVELDRDDPDGDVVTAHVELTHSPYPADAAAPPGSSRMLGVTLSWPEALDLDDAPADCDTTGPQQLTCAIPGPEAGAGTDIDVSFTLEDDVDSVAVEAKGSMLTYAPEDAEVLGDELAAEIWPLRWLASDVDTLSLD